MDFGNIIFYKNKFGIITGTNDTEYKVVFEDSSEETLIDKFQLNNGSLVIPTKFIDKLKQEQTLNSFGVETRKRMTKYYNEGRVKEFYIKSGELYSIVDGTSEYTVEINFTRLPICSCPVGLRCKHIGAVFLKLKDIFNFLEETYKDKEAKRIKEEVQRVETEAKRTLDESENAKAEANNEMVIEPKIQKLKTETDVNSFSKFFKIRRVDYIYDIPAVKLKENVEIIKNFSVEEKTAFAKALHELYKENDESQVLTLYIYTIFLFKDLEDLKSIIQNTIKDYKFLNFVDQIRLRCNKTVSRPSTVMDKEYCLFKYYLENDYSSMITNYFHYFGHYILKQKFLVLAIESVDKIEFNNDLLKYQISTYTHRTNLEIFLKKVDPSKYLELIKTYGAFICCGITLDVDPSVIIKEIEKYPSDTAVKMIETNFDYISKDCAHLFNCLTKIIERTYYFNRERIIYFIGKLPHTSIVKELFNGRAYYKEKPYLPSLTSKERLDKYDFSLEDIFTYCEITIDSDEESDYPEITISLKAGGNTLAYVVKTDDDISMECIDSLTNKHLANFLYDYVMCERKAEIEQKEAELKYKIDNRLALERLEKLNDSITQFSQQAYSEQGLTGEAKATLEVHLKASNDLKMELKIAKDGADQFYKIQSLGNFIDSFYYKNAKKYGKTLTFTHSLNNLVPPYDRLVEYLEEITTRTRYSTEIAFNTYNIKVILSILKGKYIYFNDKLTLVKLNTITPRYSIDKDYKICIDLNDNIEAYKFGNQVYAHDLVNNEINLIAVNKKDLALFEFFMKNRGTSIETVKGNFRDIIYSLNQDKIALDNNLKEDFKINDIEINGYFDYHNDKILVKSTYAKDSMEIDIKDIVSNADVSKINTYNNYLETLGFIDGEIEDETDILNFFELDFSYLKSLANVYLSESITNKYIYKMKAPIIEIEKTNSMIEAFLGESEYSEEELKKILKAIKKKKKYVLLDDNQIIKLDDKETSDFYLTLDDFNINLNKPLERVNLPVYQALKAYAHEKNCKIDDYLANMVDDIKNYKDSNLEMPKVNATLRSYQEDGVKWLTILKNYNIGGILADDMGLGKTLQVITLLTGDTKEEPSLIVCPKSLVFNWKNEFEKFSPNLNVVELYGTSGERQDVESNIKKDKKVIYIVSYDSLGRDIELLSKYDYNFLVLDEAQNIKNVNAKRSENVKSLRAVHRFALTGTPIENNVIDLWSIFDFLMPNYFEDTSEFRSRYLHDESFTEVIAKKVAPFILRRTKKDVLKDLPSKYETVITCDMNEEQRKYYDALKLEANEKMSLGGKVFDILPYLMRLRQICIDPSLFIDNTKTVGSKLSQLYDIIDDYKNEHKMLIFSQFVEALKRVENYLIKNKIPYYMITGQTDSKERLIMCNKFNNDKTPVFLISLKAGGTGLNLIGADTVIHLDPWWNSSAEDQATDRAHRIGQTRNVEVIKLIMADSIEQNVVELQNSKKDIIDKLIASDDNRLTSVSLSDLAFILK